MNNDNEHKEGQEKISKEKSLNTSVNYRQVFDDISSKHTSKRRIINKVVSVVAIVFVIGAIIPLGSILLEVIKNGIAVISIQFLTQPPGSIGSGSGGIGPAIQGTLITVGLASLIGAPIGILSGIYLSEYAPAGSAKGRKRKSN